MRRGQRSGSTWKWLLRTLLTTSFTPSICPGNTSENGEGGGEGVSTERRPDPKKQSLCVSQQALWRN